MAPSLNKNIIDTIESAGIVDIKGMDLGRLEHDLSIMSGAKYRSVSVAGICALRRQVASV